MHDAAGVKFTGTLKNALPVEAQSRLDDYFLAQMTKLTERSVCFYSKLNFFLHGFSVKQNFIATSFDVDHLCLVRCSRILGRNFLVSARFGRNILV